MHSPYAASSQPNPTAVAVSEQAAAKPRGKKIGDDLPPTPLEPVYPPGYSHLPPPPGLREFSGPTTVCQGLFAVELAAGAFALSSDNGIAVWRSREDYAKAGALFKVSNFVGQWDDVADEAVLELNGLGTVRRRSSTVSGAREVAYVITTNVGFPRLWAVSSPTFDGSAADRQVLARIRTRNASQLRPDPCFGA